MTSDLPPLRSSPSALSWGAYLGISWTWCIGMFLPVLLVRDMGVWAWAIFALPNVIGAAAMGWVLRDGAAQRLQQKHAHAIALFSIITIAFQAFFLVWAASWLPIARDVFRIGAVVGIVLSLIPRTLRDDRSWAASAWVQWVLSLGALAYAAYRSELSVPISTTPQLPATHPAPLAAVCVLGFALCPYLDATFLRARASLDAPRAKQAFGFGFGVVFFTMIIGTLLYASVFAKLLAGPMVVSWAIVALLLIHIGFQLTFTIGVHSDQPVPAPARWPIRLAPAIGALLALGLIVLASEFKFAGLSLTEVTYRAFMAFYGLVFPAYAWLCMIPTGDGHAGPRRDKLIVCAITIALAAPFYWLGFIERQTWWLAPGVAIVLIARVALRRAAPGAGA